MFRKSRPNNLDQRTKEDKDGYIANYPPPSRSERENKDRNDQRYYEVDDWILCSRRWCGEGHTLGLYHSATDRDYAKLAIPVFRLGHHPIDAVTCHAFRSLLSSLYSRNFHDY